MATAWTTADLAEMTALAVEMLANNSELSFCEHCGVVQTDQQYCDICTEDIVNWLLWEDYAAEEQWQLELDAMRCDELFLAGKGLY